MRGWLIFGIIVGISLILIQAAIDKIPEQQPTQQTQLSIPPYRQQPTEVTPTSWGLIVKMNGSEEGGIDTGIVLAPGAKAKITYLEGRITANNAGESYFPEWQTYYLPEWKDCYLYSDRPGIPGHTVLVILGEVGKEYKIYTFSFPPKTVVATNDTNTSLPLTLYYHDMQGFYKQNGWDGSRAVFEVKLLD